MFTTNTQTNVSQPEDTVVEFTCTVEANPYPVISIWRTDALGDDVQLATQTEPSLSFSTQLALRKHFNGEDFYCKVSHSSITVISDEMFSYNITCKYLKHVKRLHGLIMIFQLSSSLYRCKPNFY